MAQPSKCNPNKINNNKETNKAQYCSKIGLKALCTISLGGSFGYPVLPGSKLKTGPAIPLFCGTGYPLLSVPIIKGSVEPILRRTGYRNDYQLSRWLHTQCTAPQMHRHLYMYISCIYMYMYRVQSPNRQHVVIGCRYIHIHKSLPHAQNTQYCMHAQACTGMYRHVHLCTETTHCMHYGHTALRTYCTTDVLHYGRTATQRTYCRLNQRLR